VTAEGHSPWCGQCEWQLDAYEHRHAYAWPWNVFAKLDHKYGFRLDRIMAGAVVTGQPGAGASEWLLRLVSLALILCVAAIAGLGVWLIVAFHNGPAVIGALALFGIAYVFRPRLGRLKPLLKAAYQDAAVVVTEAEAERIDTELSRSRSTPLLSGARTPSMRTRH
jgi:hypothetical protein